jgi:hypothetical protein
MRGTGLTLSEQRAEWKFSRISFCQKNNHWVIEMYISGFDHGEIKAAVKEFGLHKDAIVMFTKWLGFGLESDVTLTAHAKRSHRL